jgi:hypothetical protein
MLSLPRILQALTQPSRIWGYDDIRSRPNPVPPKPGIYACYFRSIPYRVPSQDCVKFGNLTLLYVGVSPAQKQSQAHLRNRIRTHYKRNASASTLRLTLGCLLAEDLKIELRRTGRTERLTFGSGERNLSEWISENMFVVWHCCERPWSYEVRLIPSVSLPLNLDHNQNHGFYGTLREVRRRAREVAQRLPVIGR